MADVADVEIALRSLMTAAMFPAGTSQPSVIGSAVAVMRGWPIVSDIDLAMAAGQCLVSVYGQNNTEANVSRFQDDWRLLVPPVTTVIMTVDSTAQTVTLSGTISTPQNIAVIVGSPPGQIGVSYAIQPTDTLATAAAGLASLLADAGISVTSAGAVLTFATGAALTARPGGWGTVARELKRQERTFQICVMCPTPELRDQISPFVDRAVGRARRLMFSDGTWGRMLYTTGHVLDERETVSVYRRDVLCRVEYATIDTDQAPQVLVPSVSLQIT